MNKQIIITGDKCPEEKTAYFERESLGQGNYGLLGVGGGGGETGKTSLK